ncbi:MAG: hypothetical protein AAF830_07740 [Pseudomonadota bacterium]
MTIYLQTALVIGAAFTVFGSVFAHPGHDHTEAAHHPADPFGGLVTLSVVFVLAVGVLIFLQQRRHG